MPVRSQACMLTLALTLQAATTITYATTLDIASLPADIQTCVGSGDCIFGPGGVTSISDHNGASLFQYLDATGPKFLVRYTLTGAYQVSYDVVTPSSGYVWLGGNTQYSSANEAHSFALYLDQVSPSPTDLNFATPEGAPINLGLNTTDLLSGGASWSIYADESDGFVTYESGTLVTDGVTAESSLCLAGGCGADAAFNTVFLQFLDSGTTLDLLPILNSADTRSILYQQRTYYDDGSSGPFWTEYNEQVHSVQSVPIPSAILLFGSGLIGLIGATKRKKDINLFRSQ